MTPRELSRQELLVLVEDRWGRATEYDLRYARWQAALLAVTDASAAEADAYELLRRAIAIWRSRHDEVDAIEARLVAEHAWERAHTLLRACERRAARLHREMMEVVTCPSS